MATDLETDAAAGLTHLVSGIIADARALVWQHLALLRCELRENLWKARAAGLFLAGGLAALLAGSVMCCLMLVHLLAWVAPDLPLWACFGLIGALLAGLGGGLFRAGMRRCQTMNPLLGQSVLAVEESARWRTISR
jgi:uncharacterized membrane protein YqjE